MRAFIISISVYLARYLVGPNADLFDFLPLFGAIMIFCCVFLSHLGSKVGIYIGKVCLRHLTRRNLAGFGEQHGITVMTGREEPPPVEYAKSSSRERSARLFLTDWRDMPMMALAVSCHVPEGFWLQIRPNFGLVGNVLINVMTCRPRDLRTEEFHLRAFPLRDVAFDRAYRVKSTQPETAARVLTPEIREELVAARGRARHAPTVIIANHEVRYAVPVSLFISAAARRLINKLNLVRTLADKVENKNRRQSDSKLAPAALGRNL